MRQAARSNGRIGSLKSTLEWITIFITVVPVVGVLGSVAWKFYGESIASSYIDSVITANEKASKQNIENISKRLGEIEDFDKVLKSSFARDVSSAYFLSKTYTVGKEDSEQEPLQGFFYATTNDKITLSIFTTEHHPDLHVSINGASPISLRDIASKQQKNDWNDVDIGSFVSDTPLTADQYIGLPINVNLISVAPSPKRLKSGYTFDLYALVTVRHVK